MNIYVRTPGLSLRSNTGLKLANAFGVICCHFKLMHYLYFRAEISERLRRNLLSFQTDALPIFPRAKIKANL